ncbi:MAG: alginate O-acetyltransferase AlgX-related protein, partial [Alphaproteobacteria bacterium]
GRLQRAVGDRGRVYSFAASGAGLSQYLVWARYARERYRPGGYVFVIIGNDFAESLHEREHSPGFHRFERQPDGAAVLRRVDYEPSPIRRVLRRSALAMYLITNVKVQRLLDLDVQNLGERDRRWVANAPAAEPAAVLAEFRWSVLRFLELLPEATGVEPAAIVLAIDGFRPEMYDPAEALARAERSAWGEMRAYLAHEARARGISVVDMHPVFAQRYARDRRRFELPTDSHWNGEGHGAAADAVSGTDVFRRLFP